MYELLGYVIKKDVSNTYVTREALRVLTNLDSVWSIYRLYNEPTGTKEVDTPDALLKFKDGLQVVAADFYGYELYFSSLDEYLSGHDLKVSEEVYDSKV